MTKYLFMHAGMNIILNIWKLPQTKKLYISSLLNFSLFTL